MKSTYEEGRCEGERTGSPRLFTPRGRSHNRSGMVLVTVVVLAGTLMLVVGGLVSASFLGLRTMRFESDRSRAMAIAEAGASRTFGLLVSDLSGTNSTAPVSSANFAGGSYVVYVTCPTANVLLVTANGHYGEQNATAAATLSFSNATSGTITTTNIVGPLGALMLFAGGDMTLSGGVVINLGTFAGHCNGNLLLSASPNVTASGLSACGTTTLSGNPTVNLTSGAKRLHGNGITTLYGTINAAQITSSTKVVGNWGTTTVALNIAPIVTWPNYFSPLPPISRTAVAAVASVGLPSLDVNAFRTFAQGNTWYYEGDQTIDRTWLTADILRRTGVNVNNNNTLVAPQGGVMFVNGAVSIASDMRVQCMIIASGTVNINGAATFNNTTTYPSIVSINGNVIIGGGASGPTLNGWIYAMTGSVTAGGGASGCGIIAAQSVTVTAGYAIGSFQGTAFTSPGQQSGGSSNQPAISLSLLSWTR